MPKIAYQKWNPNVRTIQTVIHAENIINEYQSKGFDLTLRQLYYQFVARDLIANKQTEYDRLGSIISKARLAGLIDWGAIVDRTRNVKGNPHWENPGSIIQSAASSFAIEKWKHQPCYIECWIEKDALVGVIERTCRALDIRFFSCRGYTSQSEMWEAATRRFLPRINTNKKNIILHLGDHDPSGIDMSRDIKDRLELFTYETFNLQRIALNMEQINELKPPPNPTKLTDSRAKGYIRSYGYESWELDALDPTYIDKLIRREVAQYRDEDQWQKDLALEDRMRKALKEIADEHNHDNW